MPLKLVLGPANAAKAGEVLGAFSAASRRGAILVVPTAADAAHFSRELAAGGVLLGEVTTFPGLAAELAARAGYSARRLSELQRERVLRTALGRLTLGSFADSAAAGGFATAAGGLIAELQRALVTPQRFTAALRAWAREDPRRDGHAEDLASLYAAYSRELERLGRVDRELYAWRALDRLREQPGSWGATPVYFYGFDDLTGLQRDAIETLARIVGVDVVVSLPYEPGREAVRARATVVEELRALADTVQQLPALDEHYASGSRRALHRLERSLFEPEVALVGDPGDSVRLLEAGGERAEAELIAAEVLLLIRDGGYKPDEILVVCRSPVHSAPLLERVFERSGIPCDASERRPRLSHSGLGRSLLALARCAFGDESVATAAELLRYLRSPGVFARAEELDALELAVARLALRTASEARFVFAPAHPPPAHPAGPALAELDALSAAGDQGAELLRQAMRLLAAPRRGTAAVLSEREQLDTRVVAALAKALSELSELGEQPRGDELIELLETLELGAQHRGADGVVRISGPLGIRAQRFRAVFVCGLCEGEFPRPAVPDPFLSDEQRRELAIASGLALTPRDDGLAAERYLFYASVSRATERLFLSFRSSDEEGNAVLASPFVADVAELLGTEWFQRRRKRLLADVTWSLEDAPSERELALARAAAAGRAAVPTAPAERRLGERALTHVRHTEVLSGGALESYADCPVKWLVTRQLDPVMLESEPEPLTRGSYGHAVLERVFARLGEALTPATLPEATALLDEAIAEVDGSELGREIGRGRPRALRRAMRAAIAADLRRYLRHEAAGGDRWRARGLELRFGFEDDPQSLPPLRLGDGEGEVVLRGVIDRVDVDETDPAHPLAVVRDYKSAATRIEHQAGRWRSERRLQVALYMIAVRELLGLEPVAGFYQPLRGRELRARGVYREDLELGPYVFAADGRDPEGLDELLAGAAEDAVAIARRLRTGVLEPCPQTCSSDGCLFPGICRSS
ncbi:MAG: PD-(D/E)XK nuclease family protein [Solirubrobacteraceae bacterium]